MSKGLARGLGSLIPQKESLTSQVLPNTQDGVSEIETKKIVENPYQPRRHFSASDLEDLMASIKEHGVIQPLIVTRSGDGFELIAGERRLRASKSLGLKTVPAVVRTASDQEKLEIALIENIQRQDLNAIEEAIAYKALISEFNLTQQKVADRVGKSRSEVANIIRLLELPDYMKEALMEGRISRSHARNLLAEKDTDKQQRLFEEMTSGKMTIRDVERRLQGSNTSAAGSRTKKPKDPNVLAHEEKLRSIFGSKVEITRHGGKGKVSIFYYSDDELLELLNRLTDL